VRLDHLLSKEHLHIVHSRVCGVGVCQEYMPVAQTQVLRRVLMGGISTDRCLVARTGLLVRTLLSVQESMPDRFCRVVFGTLLGPEATGPGFVSLWGWFRVCLFLVSWLHRSRMFVCGVCGLGLLFENYIVDASIFYKKQFPRI
jgi:hypothetical protein